MKYKNRKNSKNVKTMLKKVSKKKSRRKSLEISTEK